MIQDIKECQVIADFSSSGGTRTYLFMVVQWLVDRGLPVSVFAISDDGIDESFVSRMAELRVGWRRLPRIVADPRLDKVGLRGVVESLVRLLFLARSRGPVVQFVSTGYPGHYLHLVPSGGRALYIVHGVGEPATSSSDGRVRRLLKVVLRKSRMKRLIGLLDRGMFVLTVSRFARRTIQINWLNGEEHANLRWVHNSIDTIDCASAPSPERVVATLGHVVGYKAPDVWVRTAVEVLQSGMNAAFKWGGEGSMLEVATALVPRKLGSSIRFVGRVNEVGAFLGGASVYFQPSRLESHGIAVLEAMSLGIPCVVSDTGGLPESVENGVTGFVVSEGDVEAFATKIRLLLDNEGLRKQMGDTSRLKFQRDFSKERWCQSMDAILAEICAGAAG